jgi:triosephosphate isomerase (TIM)
MRRPVIAGNWKMYKTVKETRDFIQTFKPLVKASTHCEIVIAPPFTALSDAVKAVHGSNIGISAQDLYWEREGAFTGEVSASMLAEAGCSYTIIGHSERRQYFGESNETVGKKIRTALSEALTPIVCVGETLAEREGSKTQLVLEAQCYQGLAALTGDDFSHIILAYEPVWAIGTGRTATPELAEEAHRFIRDMIQRAVGEKVAQNLRILYGGSVKPENIKGLMAQTDIDGALVGGASLQVDSFARIVNFEC